MEARNRAVCLVVISVFAVFSFAFITNEAVHETGHWLAHLAYGSRVGVVLDPFGGSRIVGSAGSVAPLTVTSLAGPMFSLLFSALVFSIVWHWRSPILAPFLFMFPVAMIQEGVTFSLGLLTPGGDAAYVAAWGVPVPVIALFGVFLLIAGTATLAIALPLVGVSRKDRFGRNLVLIGTGMVSLMLLRFAVSATRQSGSMTEATVPLVFSLLLALAVTAVFRPVQRAFGEPLRKRAYTPTLISTVWSLALAAATVSLQIVVLN